MRVNFCEQKSRGLTRLDVLATVLLAGVFFVLIFSMAPPNRQRAQQISCLSNLKQINLAFRIWEGDNAVRKVPMPNVAQTNGFNGAQIAWINAMADASNNFGALAVLQCPADHETPTTTNAAGLTIRISYFLNLSANQEGYPQMLLDGDDNLNVGGIPVKPGILDLSSNTLVSWAPGRHGSVNNIGLDGSVEQQSSSGLQDAIQYSFNGTP